MLLRTLAGSRAGQIEDYDYPAAINALRHGFAKRVDEPRVVMADAVSAPPAVDTRPQATTRKKRRFGAPRKRSPQCR